MLLSKSRIYEHKLITKDFSNMFILLDYFGTPCNFNLQFAAEDKLYRFTAYILKKDGITRNLIEDGLYGSIIAEDPKGIDFFIFLGADSWGIARAVATNTRNLSIITYFFCIDAKCVWWI